MTPKTLRRKLQKKKKHKPYRKCPNCGYPRHQDFTPMEALLFPMGTVPQFVHDLKARGVKRVVLEETGVGKTTPGYRLHWAEIGDMLPEAADVRELNTHRD